ncbi:MAG: hypothetical protein R3352_01125 [Salinisphaeraceae bacterium]|nr:hypothetical protein [Salinisphaeraceae bacterium]
MKTPMHAARKIGLGFVFAWFFFGGIGHFLMTDFFVSIVPPYIPWPLAAVYVSGVFELLGAIGILIPATRRLAGLGLIALTLSVSLANIHMWLHPELFPQFPEWTLTARLVVQVFLLAVIWWSTQPRRG